MAERPDFLARQYAFAAHLRDPERNPAPPDVEDRRMGVYRELFFNNVRSLLAGTFPVLSRILGEERWAALVRDFYARHRCHTPLFLEVPGEFLAYLEETRGEHADDPPFMQELAHYEWVELALNVDPAEIELDAIDRDGDLLDGVPVVSPLAWSLAYRWPVHRLGPGYQPTEPPEEATHLVVYRGVDDRIGFMEINPLTALLLERLRGEDAASGRELLLAIAREIGHPNPDAVVRGGGEILAALRRHDVVTGTRRDT